MQIMTALKLNMPKKIDVAVPANMMCGVPEAAGGADKKQKTAA